MKIFDIINNLGKTDAYTKKYEKRAHKYKEEDTHGYSKTDWTWNQTVGKVGGLRNTTQNFKNITKEFYKIGREKGISDKELQDHAQEQLESTRRFMED